jgi:hypothetical protein
MQLFYIVFCFFFNPVLYSILHSIQFCHNLLSLSWPIGQHFFTLPFTDEKLGKILFFILFFLFFLLHHRSYVAYFISWSLTMKFTSLDVLSPNFVPRAMRTISQGLKVKYLCLGKYSACILSARPELEVSHLSKNLLYVSEVHYVSPTRGKMQSIAQGWK